MEIPTNWKYDALGAGVLSLISVGDIGADGEEAENTSP
jgi:hypothetical protein